MDGVSETSLLIPTFFFLNLVCVVPDATINFLLRLYCQCNVCCWLNTYTLFDINFCMEQDACKSISSQNIYLLTY